MAAERQMRNDRPKRESMSIKETMLSNMWEIAAIVELLEQEGLCTKQDLHTIIDELRKKNPRARIPETPFPEPYLLTETENTIIDDMLKLLNRDGLTSRQSLSFFEQLGGIIEMGQRAAGSEGDDALIITRVEHEDHDDPTLQEVVVRVQGDYRSRLAPIGVTPCGCPDPVH